MSRLAVAAVMSLAIVVPFAESALAGATTMVTPERSTSLSRCKVEAFPLSSVRLTRGRWLDEQEKDRRYLHDLDSDSLLYTFRRNAGLPTPGEPMGGWETPAAMGRGEFMGHYLSACAMMYASTGDKELKAKADAIVAEMANCQERLGGGFMTAIPAEAWDHLEATVTGHPIYYTIHKLMAGLYDMYTLCGNKQALSVLEGMASYFAGRVNKLSTYDMDRVLCLEYGGMAEALYNLYSVTGKPEHLELAHKFDQAAFLGPLALGHDNLTRIHGNTNIPKVLGAARRYELTGEKEYRTAASYFWDRVVDTRTYVTGGSTMWEHWPEPNNLADTLDGLNHESCKTYNMLRLTRYLFTWTADPEYADFYERALFNGILGTQGAKPGEFSYYIAMGTGYPRMFGTKTDSFWCCYGSGVENWAKLGDSVYFHDKDDLYVNLFIPSTLDWSKRGLKIEQTTDFPNSDSTTIAVHPTKPSKFAIKLRIPYWAVNGVELRVNGKLKKTEAKPSSYLSVKREWKDGDTIELRMPMSLRSAPIQNDPKLNAVMYGPLVMAGIVGKLEAGESQIRPGHEQILDYQIPSPVIYFTGDPKKLDSWIQPVAGKPVTFTTVGQKTNIEFVPFEQLADQRYGLYWPMIAAGSEDEKALDELAATQARQVDWVFPRNPKSETAHNQQGEKSEACPVVTMNKCFRHALPDGWFSWDLKVDPGAPMSILATYWGGDGGRTFDIVVDGTVVATQELKGDHPGKLFDVEYAIPADLTRGKDVVNVAFKGRPGSMVGGVFYCATLRSGGAPETNDAK